MRKFTLFLVSLFLTVGAMAQIQVSTSVETPENVYSIYSKSGHYMSSCTGATKYQAARFAFYEAEGENVYKIFCVDANKWVSYTKADSYVDGNNKAVLVDEQAAAEGWNVTANGDYYNFAPIKNDGTAAATYWNFYGGAGASGKPYNYDATDKTIGLYNSAADDGSLWSLDLVAFATEQQVAAAKALVVVAPGYPKTTTAEYKAIDALTVGTSTTKHVEVAEAAYKTCADVILPEDGKAYTFTSVMGNGVKRYMKYVNGQKVSVVAVDGNEPSVFVCKQLRNGVYVFVTEDGCILTWVGNDEAGAYKENDNIFGYSTYYATTFNTKSDWNEITVKKNGTAVADFGYLRLVARRKSNGTSSFIVNKDNRFDQANDSYWFNNTNSSAWIVTEVEHTNTDAQNVALAKIAAKETYKNHTFGANVGQYYLNGAEKLYDKAEIIALLDAQTTVDAVTALDIQLNLPVAGNYYRIKAVDGWNNDARYLGAQNSTAKSGRAEFVADADANTIFYFDGTQLVSYSTGNYLVNNSNFLGYDGVQSAGSKIAFHAASKNLIGAYNISFNDGGRWLYCNTHNYTDAGGRDNQNGYCFNLEEVTALPVTVTAAGYATFFAPVAVEAPAGVTAHTVTINGEWATLSKALEVIPANTGVVLCAENAGTYYLTITENVEAIEGNALRGSAAATYYTAAGTYYALAVVDDEVGFYRDSFNNNRFQNNSHKAYLYVEGTQNAASYSFRFGEGTTGISEVTTENGEVKAIYDLTGRRVEAITVPGVYIVNGKKVLVK